MGVFLLTPSSQVTPLSQTALVFNIATCLPAGPSSAEQRPTTGQSSHRDSRTSPSPLPVSTLQVFSMTQYDPSTRLFWENHEPEGFHGPGCEPSNQDPRAGACSRLLQPGGRPGHALGWAAGHGKCTPVNHHLLTASGFRHGSATQPVSRGLGWGQGEVQGPLTPPLCGDNVAPVSEGRKWAALAAASV